MLKQRIIQGAFGQHFHIHSNRDGAVPRSLKPLKFQSAQSARVFLQRLQVSEEYWRILASDAEEMAPFRGHQRDYLQVISNRILNGHLRIYEVQTPDSHLLSGNLTTLQDRKGNQYLFTPASYALTRAHKPLRFNTQEEIHQRLHDLAPTLDQLQSLVTALQLAPSPKSLTYTQLVDLLAEALEEEQITLYIQAPFNRTQNNTAFETSVLVPGNRPVPLAPPSKQEPATSSQKEEDEQSDAPPPPTSPQSLDECVTLLHDARVRLDNEGYKAKYTDKQQEAKMRSGEVTRERFLVSFQAVNKDPDAKLAFRRNSGLVPAWITSFDQLENADTDPKLIAAILGTPYDPQKEYVLHIIDRGENLDLFGQNTLVPTWDNIQEPVQQYLGGTHDPDTLSEVMTPEYQREYAAHIRIYHAYELDEFDKSDFAEYLETVPDKDKEKFVTRHAIRTELGANHDFTGTGLTKSNEGSTRNGVVELLTLEHNPPPISDMKNVRTIPLTPRGQA
jgi:hypothetical protein